MLIGGFAVAIWGEPRYTRCGFQRLGRGKDFESAVARIAARLRPAPPDPLKFASERRILPVTTTNGVRADLVFASLPGEKTQLPAQWRSRSTENPSK